MSKKTKETSIYTLNGYFNYGNRLQLFALANTLNKLDIETSVYWPNRKQESLRQYVRSKSLFKLNLTKKIKIRKFTKSFLPKIDNRNTKDYAIVGSDQVWNPKYFKKRKYLLQPEKCKTQISYAASMGVEKLIKPEKELFRNALRNYKAISVREQSAKKLLQPLTDKKIEVVLDPTLLLDKSAYEKLEKRPKDIAKGEKYVLCYILGGREQQEAIEKFAKTKNFRVLLFSDKKGSSYGVEEFLYLIHHAQLICTDSFHACVFSFIFERPFVAFRRSGNANYMYSRLQNLINTFKLENREFNGEEITKDNLAVDYSEAKKILEKERKNSIEFLTNALDLDTAKISMRPLEDECKRILTQNNKISIKRIAKFVTHLKKPIIDKAFWPNAQIIYALSFNDENRNAIKKQVEAWKKTDFDIKKFDDILMAYILIYKTDSLSEAQKSTIHKNIDNALKKYYGETIPYRLTQENTIYIDLLGMVPQYLCARGKDKHDANMIRWGVQQFEEFIKNAVDEKTGLPYHAYDKKTGKKLGIIGWGRALGWILTGLSECIATLHKDYPKETTALLEQYKRLLDASLKFQREEGGFSWQLQAVDGPLDTSATSMVLQSMCAMHKIGLLDEKYYRNKQKMLECLKNNTQNGKVYSASAECGGIGIYPQKYGSYAWSVAPYLTSLFIEDIV